MSFFSKKTGKSPSHGQKIPPAGAWGHYNKKQGAKPQSADTEAHKEVLISVEELVLSYEGRAVIEGLSFNIEAGDYLCVIGENGSGKSTLMNALLGIIKPTAGRIRYHHLARNQIGVLPQQTPVQNDFPATVREVVTAGCLARANKGPFLAKDSKQIAFTNMEKLGITALEGRPFRELSGGQRQRVLIARALCAADKMLVLDEPVTGLDPATTADIYTLFRDMNSSGMTVVSVTHDVKSALKYSNKILRINKDSVFFGTVEEYAALPEALRYLTEEPEATESNVLYGEGGFRYNGGDDQ
ncbi:MAG: metal ABC transporter ATP-binding protein [Clostridia bacterium]|nr:metal ABC transporter ATP-binding protein [Clostridia bacterium]